MTRLRTASHCFENPDCLHFDNFISSLKTLIIHFDFFRQLIENPDCLDCDYFR